MAGRARRAAGWSATLAAAQPGRSVTLARAEPVGRVQAGRLADQGLGPCRQLVELRPGGSGPVGGGQPACRMSAPGRRHAGPGPSPPWPGPPSGTSGDRRGDVSARPSCCRTFFVDGLGHPLDQAVGHLVLAAVGDDLAQLGLELGGADAGPAQVQVDRMISPPLLGELPVEVEVQLVRPSRRSRRTARQPARRASGLLVSASSSSPTFSLSPSTLRACCRRGPVALPHRATPSGAPFFPGGSGSSPFRWARR